MFQFFKKKNGTITVAVTLLLIPSLIVTGTAVDVARIHAAKSMVEDANLLAANALLTEYDSMLQDVYGLYAIMEEDPVLGEMIDEYIQVAILGEDYVSNDLGTFQVFNGSTISSTTGSYVSNKNLADADVLRRQIEEYTKFRGPVVIAEEILEKLDAFEKTKADADVIAEKSNIETNLGELNDEYIKIRTSIQELDKFDAEGDQYIAYINDGLGDIQEAFEKLDDIRIEYMDLYNSCEADEDGDIVYDSQQFENIEEQYEQAKENIRSYIRGGEVKTEYEEKQDLFGRYEEGRFTDSKSVEGINDLLTGYEDFLTEYQGEVDEFVTLCKDTDAKRDGISNRVSDFETTLGSGDCSDALADGMTQPIGDDDKSTIENYEACLIYDSHPLAQEYKEANEAYLDELKSITESIVSYGKVVDNQVTEDAISFTNVSFTDMEDSMEFLVTGTPVFENDVNFWLEHDSEDLLDYFADLTQYEYEYPSYFVKYKSVSSEHDEFMSMLEKLVATTTTSEGEEDEDGSISEIFEAAQTAIDEITKIATLDNGGAKYYKTSDAESSVDSYAADEDWSDGGTDKVANAAENDIFDSLANLGDSIANKALILVYATEMFSNFSTNEGLASGEAKETSMSGTEFNTENNYFYQAEQEYIYGGNSENVRANIAGVFGLIVLIQLVTNFAISFTIPSVNNEIAGISSLGGPFAFLVGALARGAYALAESVIDLKNLTSGKEIALVKTEDSWTFTLKNIATCFTNPEQKPISGVTINYDEYLRIFLLFKSGDVIADRVSDLIGWNMTNRLEGINADEEKMTAATQFKMSQAHTDFAVTTTVDFRMIFLSMDMFQSFSDTTQPPGTIPITVTSYRGY